MVETGPSIGYKHALNYAGFARNAAHISLAKGVQPERHVLAARRCLLEFRGRIGHFDDAWISLIDFLVTPSADSSMASKIRC
jgi:hypothetical protein